jgi:hypothetical protein
VDFLLHRSYPNINRSLLLIQRISQPQNINSSYCCFSADVSIAVSHWFLFRDTACRLIHTAQKSKVYYAVIESSGRDRAKFTAGTRKLRILGKVGVLITAALAVHSVAIADNKPKETVRQGAIIGGGMAGGLGAGLAVSSLCGPGFVICAVAVVLIGSVAGGYAAEKTVDYFDDELEEFTRWNIH